MTASKPRAQPMGAKAVRGSDGARQKTALMIEVWSGLRTAQAASDAMGVALTRFYQLEARVLQTMIAALEPRPRGRQKTAEGELKKLEGEAGSLRREVERLQSLYRTAQRSLGIAVAKAAPAQKDAAKGGRRRRGPRKKARGQTIAEVLRQADPQAGAGEVADGTTEQGVVAHGQGRGG